MTTQPDWKEAFVEQVGLLADSGLPRSVARVLGWLVVCEPHHQSAEQLRARLRLSAGSVSSAVTMLVRAEIVARVTFAGDRRTYYRLRPDGWLRLLRTRLQLLTHGRQVADQALAAAGDQSDERLRGMRDSYSLLETEFARLLDAGAAGITDPAGSGRGWPTATTGHNGPGLAHLAFEGARAVKAPPGDFDALAGRLPRNGQAGDRRDRYSWGGELEVE
jgi:DNA-binding transcriptional regulator GbsR (MarR family)